MYEVRHYENVKGSKGRRIAVFIDHDDAERFATLKNVDLRNEYHVNDFERKKL